MKKKSKFKISIAVALCCLIILVLTAVAVNMTSQKLTLCGDVYTEYEETVVEFEDPEIAEAVSSSIFDGKWKVVIKGLKKGSTLITINNHHKDNPELIDKLHTRIYVLSTGLVFDSGNLFFDGLFAFCAGLSVVFLLLSFVFLVAYRRHKKDNFYSYDTPVNLGLFLFTLFHGIFFLFLFFYTILNIGTVSGENVFTLVQYALSGFVLVSLPFVFAYGIIMWISNIWLVRHEGLIKTNLLSFLLGALMIGGVVFCVLLAIFNINAFTVDVKASAVSAVRTIISALFIYFTLLLIATQYCCIIAARRKPDYDADYIIILGCAIKKDGTLYPLLRGRADKAIEFFEQQTKISLKTPIFIPSGGQGNDEVISEGEAVKNYLIEQGIDPSIIRAETESKNTLENMKFSKKIIDEKSGKAKVVFSTTNYHVFRSGIFANEAALDAEGIGSKTKWYFWPNAQIREFVGMLVKSLKLHILILVLIVTFSVLISNIGPLLNFILNNH